MKKRKDKENLWVWGSVLFLFVSILPLLYIGRYNVLSADDYSMCKEMHHIVINGGSLGDMLSYAGAYAAKSYQNWIGCYSVSLLDVWNPGVFGEQNTWITPVLMLAAVLCSTYFFIRCVISHYFGKGYQKNILILWAAFSFLIIETMPSPAEAFYWYAGAVAYTFLHFLLLIFTGLQIWSFDLQTTGGKICYAIGSSCLALILGGSQYTTALLAVILMMFLVVIQNKKIKIYRMIPIVFLVAGFLCSMLSPGNTARQSGTGGMSPVTAIFCSFAEAVYHMKAWMTPLFLGILFFMVPFLWNMIKENKKGYSFRFPAVVWFFSFCILAAGFTPSLYGVGNVDSGRIQNQLQLSFYILFVVDVIYGLGWLNRKILTSKKEVYHDIGTVIGVLEKYKAFFRILFAAIVVLVFVGTGDKNTFSSISALRSVMNGEARTYYEEGRERLAVYRDDTVVVAEVSAFTVKPHVLFFTDIVKEGDANYWINENIAEYYGKEKVILKEQSE